ncbi:MAG TPA: FtsX-like permease family protein [Bryobacteraceae bacterium]|nr:FtsX-like permease family protein [Bryobacteraceae bacterium]
MLAFAGGLLGVVLAYLGVPAIVALMPEYSVPHEAVIHVNGMVVLFTFLISVTTGILFGMAPALQLAKPGVRDAMQESGRSFTGSAQTGKTRSVLIVAEVALTMVLLVSAGIALRGFFALTQTPLGFDSSNVMSFVVEPPEGTHKTWESRRLYYQKILAALRTVPGVKSASVSVAGVPRRIYFQTEFQIADRPAASAQRTLVGLIGSDYFSTIHVPLLRGRIFTEGDFDRLMHVAVINEEMRKQFWSDGRDPIGAVIRVPQMKFEDSAFVMTPPNFDPAFQIIGVVATARNQGLHDAPKPAIYVPYTFVMPPGCAYLIRTAYDPHKFEKTFRERVKSVDPEQPIAQERTLDEVLSLQERAYPRFSSTLFTIFAAVALLLAASGIYSVVSFVVTQRTHEFGIRMALGARACNVLQLVAGMTAKLMLTGIAIGLGGAFALSKIIGGYVEGWDPKDPVAFIVVTGVMLGVGLLACWAPAYRAATIAPMISLRHE